eukprot:s1349_g10.t2
MRSSPQSYIGKYDLVSNKKVILGNKNMAEVQHGAEALHCVSSLAQGGELDEAADLIRNECSEASPSALAAVRQTVIEGFIQQDQLESACAFALEALRLPNGWEQLTMTSAEQLLRALLHGQLHSRAVELLQGLCQPGASAPSDQVFNSMLDSTVRTRSYGEAWDVLELLLKCGRKADKYFVSILTKSLEASNDKRWVRRGISLVDKFIEQQREDVDEIVFNSLLNVLGQTGDMQKLQQTLNKMNDYGVAPSAVTFGTVVKAYGRARDTESVIKVWNQMRSRCLGINPVTCGCVLDACVKCNSLDKAMAIFQEMRMQGMHKNTVLYATLIKGLAKVRDLQGAMNLYHEMRMEGVPCNLVTFNSLMDVCVRCGDLQTAAYFLQDMMGMGIDPDLITFSTLIKGYSHIGEVHKALALSKELKARGLKCDEIMYNSLIDGCAKARKVTEGLAVFEEMLQSRVQPSNITFSILVKLHFEVGQIAEAFRLTATLSCLAAFREQNKCNLPSEVWPKRRWGPNMSLYSLLGPRRPGWEFPSIFSNSMSSSDVALLKEVESLMPDSITKPRFVESDRDDIHVLEELRCYFGEDRCAAGLIVFLQTVQNYPRPIPLSAFAAGVAVVDGVLAEDRGHFFDCGLGGDSNWAHASTFEQVLSRCRLKLLDLRLEERRSFHGKLLISTRGDLGQNCFKTCCPDFNLSRPHDAPQLRLREALREVHNSARHAADDLLEVLYIGLRTKPALERFSYLDLCECMKARAFVAPRHLATWRTWEGTDEEKRGGSTTGILDGCVQVLGIQAWTAFWELHGLYCLLSALLKRLEICFAAVQDYARHLSDGPADPNGCAASSRLSIRDINEPSCNGCDGSFGHTEEMPTNEGMSLRKAHELAPASCAKVSELVDVFCKITGVEDMPKHRCMPGRIVYTVLLRCSCQTGRPALAQAAQLLIDLSRKNSKLPDQVMVSSVLSACVQHSDFDSIGRLVREFATGSRRSSSVGLENLKHCFEALGSLNEELGKELLEYLRSRSAPASHISILEAAIQTGKENPGWSSAVDTGCEQEESTEGVQQYPNHQAYAPAGMMQMPQMCPDMYGWDQAAYAHGQNPYYAQYTEAAAAAACAATAAYNQHMARFAAQAAAAYPQFSIIPPFLPSLKMEMPPMAPDAAWVPTLPAAPAVPAPASFR